MFLLEPTTSVLPFFVFFTNLDLTLPELEYFFFFRDHFPDVGISLLLTIWEKSSGVEFSDLWCCSSMRLSGGGDLLHDRDPRDTHRSGVDGIIPVGTPANKMLMYLIESQVKPLFRWLYHNQDLSSRVYGEGSPF